MQRLAVMNRILVLLMTVACGVASAYADGIRLKDLSRLKEERSNMLVGYGIVTGLAGTGDSANNRLTQQSIGNVLEQLGVQIPDAVVRSRNVAVVMVTAALPSYAQPGDQLDVHVTSMGDARSLVGGSLLLTPLRAPNNAIYALAQGALSVGGYKYDLNGNVVQKNHPTSGNIPNGANVERALQEGVPMNSSGVEFVLFEPDLTTANRIVAAINARYGGTAAEVIDAGRYRVNTGARTRAESFAMLGTLESLQIAPDGRARVVVNERTGTVVSGGDVRISQTTITHGDLIVAITTDYNVSQPAAYFGDIESPEVRTVVVPDTTIEVHEPDSKSVSLRGQSTVADLVAALNRVKASSRDIITVLQGLKRAGALHAELVIQ